MKIFSRTYMVGSGEFGLSNEMDCHVYLVDCGRELALVDTGVGLETDMILRNIRSEGFKAEDITTVLLTHCHADHAGGCRRIKEETGCSVAATRDEARVIEGGTDTELGLDVAKTSGIYPRSYRYEHCRVDKVVKHGDEIRVGECSFKVFEIPGHSWATACYLLELEGRRALFSSDVVFYGGTIGLGNWPGSSLENYRKYLRRLGGLNVDILLPGHFTWTLRNGQKHIDRALENLKRAWVPPAWRHHHFHV